MAMQVTSVVPRDGFTLREAQAIGRAADRLKSYREAAKLVDDGGLLTLGTHKLHLVPSAVEATLDLLIEREVLFLSTMGVVDAAGS